MRENSDKALSKLFNDFNELFVEDVKDDQKARELWGSLANVEWVCEEGKTGVSFRTAGHWIASLRGDTSTMGYMDWYCSSEYGWARMWVAQKLGEKGWIPISMDDYDLVNSKPST